MVATPATSGRNLLGSPRPSSKPVDVKVQTTRREARHMAV
jgi:hypothetical protein